MGRKGHLQGLLVQKEEQVRPAMRQYKTLTSRRLRFLNSVSRRIQGAYLSYSLASSPRSIRST